MQLVQKIGLPTSITGKVPLLVYQLDSSAVLTLISIAAAPPFPGLRRFPDGRGFTQWTGDDSKALMKVCRLCFLKMTHTYSSNSSTRYICQPLRVIYIPDDMIRTFCAFLEICYLVRCNVITDDTLAKFREALDRFHQYHEVFRDTGIRPRGFSLPHQHSLVHYEALI